MVESTIKTKEEYWKHYKDKYDLEKDWVETAMEQLVETDYPCPNVKKARGHPYRFRLIYETFQNSIEESYFWVLNYMRYDVGFADIDKITDIFAAAETSAFGGVQQQRIGLQQDKVTQFMAAIGKMTKDLFQLVRELRVLDERLGYYEKCKNPNKRIAEPADITLKGIYIDMAEGGAKSPASVFGMARELQFTTLPDLFFSTFPRTSDEVGKIVDALDFNKNVKVVLKRKLFSFLRWKEETEKELKSRKIFTLKYLRQHFDVIKMYMHWVKPYLKNIRRLQSDQMKLDTPDLIASFEGSMVEIEILAKYTPGPNKDYKSVIISLFEYRTRPAMNYTAEHYQRGPLHVGELKITHRGYTWDDEDIANYKKYRELDDLDLLKSIDGSIKAAMEALGDELEKYLEEAGRAEGFDKSEIEKPKLPTVVSPLGSALKGFRDIFGALGGKSKTGKKRNKFVIEQEIKAAIADLKPKMWLVYKNYKKAHKMITW